MTPSNTTDPSVPMRIDDDDREYFANSGHQVPRRTPRQTSHQQQLLIQAGLTA